MKILQTAYSVIIIVITFPSPGIPADTAIDRIRGMRERAKFLENPGE